MEKKTMLIGGCVLAVLLLFAGLIGYQTGCHFTEVRLQEVKEKQIEETFASEAEEKKEPEEEASGQEDPAEQELQFTDFPECFGETLSPKELETVYTAIREYLADTSFHTGITEVTCLDYVTEEEGQLSFYVKLSDGFLLAGYYDKGEKAASIKETAVTEKILEANAQAEQEKEEQMRLSEEAFDRPEGGVTVTPTPDPTALPTATPKATETPKPASAPSEGGNTAIPNQQGTAQTVYPYTFSGFELFADFISGEQTEEVKGWISGLLQESDAYRGIQTVTAKRAKADGAVVWVYCTLDAQGTLEVEYHTDSLEATIRFDTVPVEELQ